MHFTPCARRLHEICAYLVERKKNTKDRLSYCTAAEYEFEEVMKQAREKKQIAKCIHKINLNMIQRDNNQVSCVLQLFFAQFKLCTTFDRHTNKQRKELLYKMHL